MIPLHKLPANLRELREVKRPLFEKEVEAQCDKHGAVSRSRSEFVRGRALYFGFYALAIEHDDALAAGYFRLAAECALKALTEPSAEPPVAASEIKVVVDPDTLKTEVESITPVGNGYGGARMSVIEFQAAFFTLAAFGDDASWAVAGGVPESEYRSPGIVASDNYYAVIRSYKARALDDNEAAVAELATATQDAHEATRPDVKALQALDRKDERGFRGHLLDLLKKHRKNAEKRPGAIDMLMQQAGMGLCRLALRQGIRVEDQNYLPLRFSPWYQKG